MARLRDECLMIERLEAKAAIERINELRHRQKLILGVDGFITGPGGVEAPIDLVLDLSTGPISVDEAAAEAEKFVAANARANVTFEIVS